jgi:penicillin amidase
LDAAELVDQLLEMDAQDAREVEALTRLREWDGSLSAESVAATIYEVTQIELLHGMFAERMGAAFGGYIGDGQTALFTNPNFSNIALRQVRVMLQRDPKRAEVLHKALRAALDRLTAHFGTDMSQWRWGELHRVEPMHYLGRIGPLRRVFNRGSYPIGGDGDTPQQANFRPRWPIEAVTIAPSHRVVYDVGAWDHSCAVLPGGQSGHPASPHYFDQFSLWLKGEARPMLWSREAIEREAEARLMLMPKN